MDHWLSIFTQDANIVLRVSEFALSHCEQTPPTSHHVRAQQATPTAINNGAWRARYLCLSVPIGVLQTRRDLYWTLQSVSCNTSGAVRRTSSFLFLGKHDEETIVITGGWFHFSLPKLWVNLFSHVVVANSNRGWCEDFWSEYFRSKHFAPSEQTIQKCKKTKVILFVKFALYNVWCWHLKSNQRLFILVITLFWKIIHQFRDNGNNFKMQVSFLSVCLYLTSKVFKKRDTVAATGQNTLFHPLLFSNRTNPRVYKNWKKKYHHSTSRC